MPLCIRGHVDYSKCKPPASKPRPRKYYVRHAKPKTDRGTPWTFEEKQKLRKLLITMTPKEAVPHMPDRNHRAVAHMASKLGWREKGGFRKCP